MDNTLFQELCKCGVDSEHLIKTDQEKPISSEELERYYDYVKEEEQKKLVDVTKIKGLTDTRLNVNGTWWEHFNGEAEVLAHNRIETLFERLKEKGLLRFIFSFEESRYCVPLAYFDKEDIYFAYGDGNHRTVFAKIVNAPYIFAKVSYYKYNPVSERNYIQYKKWFQDLCSSVEKLGFRIEQGWIKYKDVSIIDIDIYMPSNFNLSDKDMNFIHEKFKNLQKELTFIEEKVRLLRFFSLKWKIRICTLFSHWGDDFNKMILYGALASLLEEGYTI
ncbi:hypothetical protein [Bacillus bingmayongensis]|uniref:hypothetical protein n=1 Tax=Bacillus bingmayongensis TaxID=1150157 RepID=UPI001C8E6ECE|nr:hypothetical protein [Bacillus bingmayongensis]MBY0598967.1 hypothetical protein [Bacillus bingmayongensis]